MIATQSETIRLHLAEESLFPDGAFRLVGADRQAFAYFLELDNSTESIRSQTSLDCWQRKVRFYERYQDAKPERFRVLAITTGGELRLRNVLGCAASLARNPQRSLVYQYYDLAEQPAQSQQNVRLIGMRAVFINCF